MEEKGWCGGGYFLVMGIKEIWCVRNHESHLDLENGVETEYCKTHKKFREIKYKQVK